jgi:hypothetical protein
MTSGTIAEYLKKYAPGAESASTANSHRAVHESLGTTPIHKFMADTTVAISQLSEDVHAMKVSLDLVLGRLDELKAVVSANTAARAASVVPIDESISTMSRGKPLSSSASKYTYKGSAVNSSFRMMAAVICTIVDICVERHTSLDRNLSSSTLDLKYLAPIIKLVMSKMAPNMSDSLTFSSDAMNSMKLSLCTTQASGTMVVSEATFVNARASWRNQLDAVEWAISVLARLHSVFDESTTRVLRSIGKPMLGSDCINYMDCGTLKHHDNALYQRLYQLPAVKRAIIITTMIDEVCANIDRNVVSKRPTF